MKNTRSTVEAILAQHPDLTMKGVGGFCDEGETPEQSRAKMLTDEALAQFERACGWLAKVEKSPSVNKDAGTSYGLKHAAERYWRKQYRADPATKENDAYISEGMFICAALHLGFSTRREENTASVCVNIAKRSLKDVDEPKKRRPKRGGSRTRRG